MLFVKGGSIIPALNHEHALSLMRCINKPIILKVYIDKYGKAEGSLVLDDGISVNSNTSKYKFTLHANKLTVTVDQLEDLP